MAKTKTTTSTADSFKEKSKGYLENYFKMLDEFLKKDNAFTSGLSLLESKIGIKKQHSFMAIVVLFASYIIFGQGSNFLIYVLGFAYPAYQSIKAIESTKKDDDTKWLVYWVVNGCIGLLEFFTDIFFFWMPMYNLFKLFFLLYLMAPVENNGSMLVYNTIVRPFFLKHQDSIQKEVQKMSKIAGSAIDKAKDAATDYAADMAASAMKESNKEGEDNSQ